MPTAIQSEQLPVSPLTIQAAGTVAAKRFVGYDGNVCAAGKPAVGVNTFDAVAGQQMTVYGPGNVKWVTSGAAVNAGDNVASDASGKAVTAAALAIASGATAVTSAAANGASDIVGGAPPTTVNGLALTTTTGADQDLLVLLF